MYHHLVYASAFWLFTTNKPRLPEWAKATKSLVKIRIQQNNINLHYTSILKDTTLQNHVTYLYDNEIPVQPLIYNIHWQRRHKLSQHYNNRIICTLKLYIIELIVFAPVQKKSYPQIYKTKLSFAQNILRLVKIKYYDPFIFYNHLYKKLDRQ